MAILRGLRKALVRTRVLGEVGGGGPTVDEPDDILGGDGYSKVYYDEVTGMPLSSALAREAIQLEIKYMRDMNVYREVSAAWCRERGLVPVGTRFLYVNKGDANKPHYQGTFGRPGNP